MNNVELFTDGACRGNPGPGGWGVLLRYREHERTLKGYEANTTNNRMELTAAIKGLAVLKRPCQIKLFTDSEYLKLGMTRWLKLWKARGWKNAQKKSIKNQDLWIELDQVASLHQIEWIWVKAHNGHVENEQVDALANQAIDEGMS